MTDAEYKDLRDLFVKIAKGKYPEGFKRLKKLEQNRHLSGDAGTYEVTFNEVVLLLFQYINIELKGKERHLKELTFRRILTDIVTND